MVSKYRLDSTIKATKVNINQSRRLLISIIGRRRRFMENLSNVLSPFLGEGGR